MIVIWTFQVAAQLPPASFYHLKRDKELYSSTFHALTEDARGFIWFGSYGGGGLYRYDGYELRSFYTDPARLDSTIAGIRITSTLEISDTLLMVATTFGFTSLNPVTGRLKNYNNDVLKVKDTRIGGTWSFSYDSLRQWVWVATHAGLGRLHLPTDSFEMISLVPDAGTQIVDGLHFTLIVPDPSDTSFLYLSGPYGLFHFSIENHRIRRLDCPLVAIAPLHVYRLHADADKSLWIGTNQGDILRYDPSGQWKRYHIYPDQDQYPEPPIIRDMVKQNENMMWVSTTRQVGLLNLSTGAFETWTYSPNLPDGLLPNLDYVQMIADRHGRLWISSWHGIQYAKQAFVRDIRTDIRPRVAITHVEITPMYAKKSEPLLYEGTLQLQKDQRDIRLQYVLPNPLSTSEVTYQYMMKGYDRDWITTEQRMVRYTKMPGGEFEFMVRAREGATEEWSPVTRLRLVIPKRLTELAWFWILTGLVILGLAFLVYRILISRARKEERMKSEFEHQLSEIQMQALRAQMNPHFLFNSLNSIKYFAISKSKDETAAYLSKFAMLVRAILNNSKERTISLKEELEALRLYIEIEHLRLEGKFDYAIDIDQNIHVRQAQIPPMILQPYVENAIWHGLMHKDGKGTLLIQVRDMGHQIQCIIEDNGIGRARSAEKKKAQLDHKKSVGMQITGDRIALINRIYHIDTQVHVVDLTDEKGTPCGTRVIINIPLIRDEEE